MILRRGPILFLSWVSLLIFLIVFTALCPWRHPGRCWCTASFHSIPADRLLEWFVLQSVQCFLLDCRSFIKMLTINLALVWELAHIASLPLGSFFSLMLSIHFLIQPWIWSARENGFFLSLLNHQWFHWQRGSYNVGLAELQRSVPLILSRTLIQKKVTNYVNTVNVLWDG